MSNKQSEYNIELKTSDPALLVSVFGSELPEEGSQSSLDPNVSIQARQVSVQHGLVETSIIVNCLLQILGGVAVKVVGDLLVNKLKGKDAELTINGKKIKKITTIEVLTALEETEDVER